MIELTVRLVELRPRLVVMEATGGLERSVQSVLEEAGLPVVLSILGTPVILLRLLEF